MGKENSEEKIEEIITVDGGEPYVEGVVVDIKPAVKVLWWEALKRKLAPIRRGPARSTYLTLVYDTERRGHLEFAKPFVTGLNPNLGKGPSWYVCWEMSPRKLAAFIKRMHPLFEVLYSGMRPVEINGGRYFEQSKRAKMAYNEIWFRLYNLEKKEVGHLIYAPEEKEKEK